jgi:hypothetical protein
MYSLKTSPSVLHPASEHRPTVSPYNTASLYNDPLGLKEERELVSLDSNVDGTMPHGGMFT